MRTVPPGTKVTCPTEPWRLRQPARRPSTTHPSRVLHAVSQIAGEHLPVALCKIDTVLADRPPTRDEAQALDVHRCEDCVDRLRWNGLWPLGLPVWVTGPRNAGGRAIPKG